MDPDPKQGEREYFSRIGAAGIVHSSRKPFSDGDCVLNLSNMDALFHLMEPPPGRVVEFGCGVGWLSLFLAHRGYQVTGVDISPDAIAAARAQGQAQGLANARFVLGDYESFATDEKCDCAIFYDSLHHAENELTAVRCACAALRPDGMMIAFETNAGHSKTAEALKAVGEFRVHEKDMPVDYIARLGRQAGFSRHLILQRPHQLMRSLYRPSYGRGASLFDLKTRLFLSKLRIIRRLFTPGDAHFIVLWK